MAFTPESYGAPLLDRFAICEDHILGQGYESRVFALDKANVLRIFAPGTTQQNIESRANFYDKVDASKVSFSLPEISEMGYEYDYYFTIEKRLGSSLEQMLNSVNDPSIQNSVDQYAATLMQIQDIEFPGQDLYGQVIGNDILRSDSWSEFLVAKVNRALESSRKDLQDDVTRFTQVYEWWLSVISTLPDPEPKLVHGDFNPGNLICDESGITHVIDFGKYALIGDSQLEIGIAYGMSGAGYFSEQQVAQIRSDLRKSSPMDEEKLVAYTTYLALSLSDCKRKHPWFYKWVVKRLNKTAETYS